MGFVVSLEGFAAVFLKALKGIHVIIFDKVFMEYTNQPLLLERD